MTRVYLDIDIGDKDAFLRASQDFTRSQSFYDQVGPQFGLIGKLEDLDAESVSMLSEAFASDPKWHSQGAFSAIRPPSLRAGRLIIDLFSKEVPKTAENFRCLLTGEKGKGKSSGKPLHYKGCQFHRVVSGFMAQAGDIVKGDGSGGDSIYGGKFNDEKSGLKLKHQRRGLLGMANSGKNSNTSQFYITLAPSLPQLDGKHVIFGEVVEGLEILDRIETEVASKDGKPQQSMVIADCGVL